MSFFGKHACDFYNAHINIKINQIKNLVTEIQQTTKKARELGFIVKGDIQKKDLKNLDELLREARMRFLQRAHKHKNPELVVQLINMLPIYNLTGDPNAQE